MNAGLLSVAALLLTARLALSAEVPEGFTLETLATELNAATALTVAPDGRIFIADQTGPLRLWKNGRLLPAPALDLSPRLDTYWERGLIGVTLHPDFPHTPHLFLMYVAKEPFTHHVISRFTVVGDQVDPASERVLLTGDDQSKLVAKLPSGHQGGPLRFGPDGKLHAAIGEQTTRTPAQSLDCLRGKILRLNADGSIPEDNPFFTQTTGFNRAIWALGLRNPFGLAFQPETGRLFATDVGEASFEEVDEIVRGGNYGWPEVEGYSTDPRFRSPLHAYPHAIGRCIAGAAFYPRTGSALFPAAWRGKFFFADWSDHWIKALDPEHPETATTFAKGFNAPTALEVAPDGSLLLLDRATIWRDPKKWQPHTGSLFRIRYTGQATEPAHQSPPFPTLLSAAGVFQTLAPLTPRAGFVEYQINLPPWQPGLSSRRWISVPAGGKITINADGEFAYPPGTIIAQHFTVTKTDAPFETHLLWLTGPRLARAAAYRWSHDGQDATLVKDGEIITLPGDRDRHWYSPGTEENLNLDLTVAGFLLPLNARQLSSGTPLQQWLTPPLAQASNLTALDNSNAPLELRVRSYLDVNCATCHRPGGPSRGNFDARFSTPLAQQGLLNGEPIAGDLGLHGAKLIVPGHPERSLLLQRLSRYDQFRMPPISVNNEPQPIVALLQEWIRSL